METIETLQAKLDLLKESFIIEEKKLLDAFDNMFKSFLARNDAIMEKRKLSKINLSDNILLSFEIRIDEYSTLFEFCDDNYSLKINELHYGLFDKSTNGAFKRITMLSDLIKAISQIESSLKYLLQCAKANWYKTLTEIESIEFKIKQLNENNIKKDLENILSTVKIGSKMRHPANINHFDKIFNDDAEVVKISEKFFIFSIGDNPNKRIHKDVICRLIYENKVEVF